MQIDRQKFLSALLAMGLGGAVACGGEEPPAAEPETEVTTGAEEPVAEPVAEPEPEPVAEPEPVVEETETGPTTE